MCASPLPDLSDPDRIYYFVLSYTFAPDGMSFWVEPGMFDTLDQAFRASHNLISVRFVCSVASRVCASGAQWLVMLYAFRYIGPERMVGVRWIVIVPKP